MIGVANNTKPLNKCLCELAENGQEAEKNFFRNGWDFSKIDKNYKS